MPCRPLLVISIQLQSEDKPINVYLTLTQMPESIIIDTVIVGSQGDVQLGGPVLACAVGPTKVKALLKSKENQNTCLI